MNKKLQEQSSKLSDLSDFKLLELAGIILEMVDARGNIRTNDLVMDVIDIIIKGDKK